MENFGASPDKSLSEAYDEGSIGSQFHTDFAIDGLTLNFLESTALDDGEDSTNSEDVVDPPLTPRSSRCS